MGLRHSAFYSHYRGSESVDGEGSVNSTIAELMLRHHLSDRISVGLTLPTGFVLFDPGASAVKQRASGFGDLELLGRYVLRRGRGFGVNLELESSLFLPTGESNLAAAQTDADAPPNILSIGRGAFAGSARLAARKFLARDWIVRGWVGAARPFSANANDIRFGNQFNGGLGLTYLATDKWILGSQLSATSLTRSRSTQKGELINSGGYWVHADLMAGLRVHEDCNIALTARAPVYRDVQGEQIAETLTVLAQLTLQFGDDGAEQEHEHGDEHEHGGETNADDEHEHEHEHGHGAAHQHGDEHGHERLPAVETQPDTTALDRDPAPTMRADIADAARDGVSFDAGRVAVPGKITVVDFWASWCGPCKPLTQGLEALARKHPDIAVRKVEVPDFDQAVAEEHLADAKGLPIVWLYDRQGKRVQVLVQKQLDEVAGYIEKLQAE